MLGVKLAGLTIEPEPFESKNGVALERVLLRAEVFDTKSWFVLRNALLYLANIPPCSFFFWAYADLVYEHVLVPLADLLLFREEMVAFVGLAMTTLVWSADSLIFGWKVHSFISFCSL